MVQNSYSHAPGAQKSSKPGASHEIPVQKTLESDYHVYQSFNNCGPASLSMALSYFDVHVSQQELGESLRPYQNQSGINDDKSVSLEELGNKAREYGLIPYHRPNGTTALIEQLISIGIPVITRTWLKSDEDIGHYRVVKGYDRNERTLIQDDSFLGNDLIYSYVEFDELWGKFNYEYLVLVPKHKKHLVEDLLGKDVEESYAWERAARNARATLTDDPDDIHARFNLSVALYNTGDFAGSVREFEAVQYRIPSRTLWYQIEPIEAYYKLGDYTRVFEISDSILNNANRAFSELYVLRGNAYKNLGNLSRSRTEYELAIHYNRHLKRARDALAAVL